jgi:Tfp pilus assembly protein PilN
MTAIQMRPVGPWNVRPGWGVAVNLTPPQLVTARRLRTVRKLIASGVGVVVLGCGAGYFLADRQHADAENAVASVQVQTAQLQAELAKYSSTTKIQSAVSGMRQEISAIMTGDVASDALLAQIRAALPANVSIQAVSVVVSQAGVAAATPDTAGTTGLSDPRYPRIGDISITGNGQTLADVSAFVAKLQGLRGLVDVIPTSNAADKTGVQYSITLGFTDQLRTHAYDITQAGTK